MNNTEPAIDGVGELNRQQPPEERYHAIFEHAAEITAVMSAVRDRSGAVIDWRYQDANSNAVALLKLSRAELIGKCMSEVLPTIAARLIPLFARVLEKRAPYHYESYFAERSFLVSISALDDETIVSSAIDITARLRSARELELESRANRAEKEWLTAVLNSMTEEVYFTHVNGHYTYANPAAMREFGHAAVDGTPVEKVVEKLEVLRPDGTPRPLSEAPPLRALRGEIIRNEEQIVRIPRTGEWRHRQVSAAPVRNDHGDIIGSVSVVRDVTEQKKAETALLEAAKRKDEFLAVLAHELRNPLAALYAAAQLLSKENQKPQTVAMARDALQRQVNHMARLLDDLLDAARITHGRVQLQLKPLDLAQVIQSVIETVRPQFEAKQHQLEIKLESTPVYVDGDAVRLAQVVGNLLTNAARYTPANGRVVIELRLDRNRNAVICVRDNGIGIPPQTLPYVFEMFSQASRSQNTAGGLGIGLALVKGLVELHGGKVEARSGGSGAGSEFIISLPLAMVERQVENAVVHHGQVSLRPLRILIADDNIDSANSWSALLQAQGHRVQTAFDGRTAWETAELLKPEVALLDIGMPYLTGYEVAKNIRASEWGANTKLIAITGWGQSKDREAAQAAGFDHHLTKPASFETIVALLATL